jgi:hypothetical protein
MEVHKPKPWHNLRELAKEVAIIVIGVLIALAAEQTVEMLRWRQAVGAGRETLHKEIAFDNGYFRDRITIAPCMDRRLAALTALVASAAAGKPPNGPDGPRPMVPGRLTLVSAWNAEEASQTLTHFPREELTKLGSYYDLLQTMRGWIEQENDAWASLGSLGSKGPIGPQDIALLRRDLQRARYLEFLTVLNARRELGHGREFGVQPGPSRQDYIASVCMVPAGSPWAMSQ